MSCRTLNRGVASHSMRGVEDVPHIVLSTTFRDFDGSRNDCMQLKFLYSLKRQAYQDFILVVTIFQEKKVVQVVKKILGDKAVFIYDCGSEKYKFSLSKTFMNGVEYGLENRADILVDCSSDIVLQKNFLETVRRKVRSHTAGISHPNVFVERDRDAKRKYIYGRLNRGIDIRFYTLDLFQDKHVYEIMGRFPSYDYGAGIERVLCGIAIKYAKKRVNIFMESKVLKEENSREEQRGIETEFMREGVIRNVPITERFMQREQISKKYMSLLEMNQAYKITKKKLLYQLMFGREIISFRFRQFAVALKE